MKQHRCSPPEFTCQQCGLTFENAASRARQKYCSQACFRASLRLPPDVLLEHHRAGSRRHHAIFRQSYSAHMVAWRKELRRRGAEASKVERAAALERQKAETKAHAAEKQRVWRLANPDRMRVLIRRWKKANPEAVKAGRKRYAAKQKAARKDVPAAPRPPSAGPRRRRRYGPNGDSRRRARKVLMKVQKGRCAYCRVKLGADCHIDHIIPLSKGGPNRRSNLQLACAPCNLAKSDRHPVEFARSLGRLL